MELIDTIYFINLDKRHDRLKQIAGEFERMQIPFDNIIRVKAFEHEIGTIGCSKSHIWALRHFIESGKKRCMILEDDFEFTESRESVDRILRHIFTGNIPVDLLMIAGNGVSVFDTVEDNANYLQRVAFSNTSAGYIITDKFAPALLFNFNQGLSKQEQWVNVYGSPETAFNLDFHWIYIHALNLCYFTFPKLGRQRDSPSDIFPTANYKLGHFHVPPQPKKKIKGLDDIDLFYYINLDKRVDRLKQITGELEKIKAPVEKIQRISAIENRYGIYGCGLSHCLALKTFIESGKDLCLILEDDFEFTESRAKIDEVLTRALTSPWDIGCLLMDGSRNSTQPPNLKFCVQNVIFSVCCPAYLVTKAYAPALLYNILESSSKQEKWIKVFGAPENAFNNDLYWIFEQVYGKFFMTVPLLGKQRKSDSDITNTSDVTMRIFDPAKDKLSFT